MKTLIELIDEYDEVTEQNQCSRIIGFLDTNKLEKKTIKVQSHQKNNMFGNE